MRANGFADLKKEKHKKQCNQLNGGNMDKNFDYSILDRAIEKFGNKESSLIAILQGLALA